MSNDNMRQFYAEGLQALQEAGRKGHEAASETMQAATSPELRQLMQQGTDLAQQHAKRMESLAQQAGVQPGGQRNEIIEGIQAGAKRIREAAKDDAVRDAGIIASAQIALHYHIAAYGSLAAHAKVLGMNDEAAQLKQMADECKQIDQRYTGLAEQAVNPQAKAA